MSNFETELRALVEEWLKRGDDFLSVYDALRNEADRLRDMREGIFPNKSEGKVNGVGRMADNPRAVLVTLSVEPTDDEMRDFHEFLRGWH